MLYRLQEGTLPDEYLTVKEAAREIGVSDATVRRYITTGKLPARRRGIWEYRISREELTAFLARYNPEDDQEREADGQ